MSDPNPSIHDEFENEFKTLETWAAEIGDVSQLVSLDPLRSFQRLVVFGYVAALYVPLKVDPKAKAGAVVRILLDSGARHCGNYRYWFVFDKDAGFVILEIYTYCHKNVRTPPKG